MYKYSVEYSNLVARFGASELLDVFKERFNPIFKSVLNRKTGETYQYRFRDISFITIDKQPYIMGRLMARMKLKARQKQRDGELHKTRDFIQSDPTSLFLLRMADHKLIVVPEQPRSPKTKTFEYVIKTMLRNEWDKLYNRERIKFLKKNNLKRMSKDKNEEFWKYFGTKYPEPTLNINPIGSPEHVANVLSAFSKVKTLKLVFNKPNNEDFELDEQLVKMFSESVMRTNSTSASQDYKNPKDGLDTAAVENLVKASTETGGNCNFRVSGTSTTGVPITRTDEHTKIRPTVEFEQEPTALEILRSAMSKLEELIENEQISMANTPNLEDKLTLANRIKNELE